MNYDFETLVDRTGSGSIKWDQMKEWKPDVSRGIVPFSIADMELRNPPEVIEGLKRYLDAAILGYTQPTDAYYAAVCGWMKRRHDWDIRPEWIEGSAGVVEAFFTAIRALSEPGDGVIIQTPVYYPFYAAIERNKRKVVRNPLVFTGETYLIDYEDLERKAGDPANKVLLFCSPHNPTGRVWKREELERVADICLRHHVHIISDEIHFDLVMPGHRHTVFATISEELADDMVVCTAPSKTFNLAGMQTSNIVIPNAKLREAYHREAAANGFSCLGPLGYKACEIAYNQCEAWLDELIDLVWRNHRELCRLVSEGMPGIKALPLEGTYLQWMDCRGLGLDNASLERLMHERAELFLDEGYVFGEEGSGFERMNLACPTKVLRDALSRLAVALE